MDLQDCFFYGTLAFIAGLTAKPQGLLQRLLNTPDLPAIVPRLQPDILHRVIQTCGLEDCRTSAWDAIVELLALRTRSWQAARSRGARSMDGE